MCLEQLIEDGTICQPLIDGCRKLLPHIVGHATAVGIAAGKRVDMTCTSIFVHATSAVDARQKPFDAFIPGSLVVDIRGIG